MGNTSRRKGSAGERDFSTALFDELGIRLVRRLEQPRQGGHDLEVDPAAAGPVAETLRCYAIEIKRVARATPHHLRGWWAQACVQADTAGLVPALAYREDRCPWRVVVPMNMIDVDMPQHPDLDYTAELSLVGFAAVIREGGTV